MKLNTTILPKINIFHRSDHQSNHGRLLWWSDLWKVLIKQWYNQNITKTLIHNWIWLGQPEVLYLSPCPPTHNASGANRILYSHTHFVQSQIFLHNEKSYSSERQLVKCNAQPAILRQFLWSCWIKMHIIKVWLKDHSLPLIKMKFLIM